MALSIISESYGPRKPLVVCEADSLDDLADLVDVQEGSKATVGGKEYVFENNSGWVEPGGGGGGGGSGGALVVNEITVDETTKRLDKTMGEIINAMPLVFIYGSQTEEGNTYFYYYQLDTYALSATGDYLIEYGADTYSAASLDDYPTEGGQ